MYNLIFFNNSLVCSALVYLKRLLTITACIDVFVQTKEQFGTDKQRYLNSKVIAEHELLGTEV